MIIRVSFEIYFKDELLCEMTMNELFISNKRVTFFHLLISDIFRKFTIRKYLRILNFAGKYFWAVFGCKSPVAVMKGR